METESEKMTRQFLYLANTTRLIRHLAALAKLAMLKACQPTDQASEMSGWWREGALEAYCTALGAALLDDMGRHHYTAAQAEEHGRKWLRNHEDLIQV